MTHKFKVRQMVRLAQPGFSDTRMNSGNVYEVVRLMPADRRSVIPHQVGHDRKSCPRGRNPERLGAHA
jgi:hypothetical protein